MTRAIWKSCAIVLLASCSHNPRVKIYVSLPERGGLVRQQDNEVIPYAESKGYFCINGDGLEVMMMESQRGEK